MSIRIDEIDNEFINFVLSLRRNFMDEANYNEYDNDYMSHMDNKIWNRYYLNRYIKYRSMSYNDAEKEYKAKWKASTAKCIRTNKRCHEYIGKIKDLNLREDFEKYAIAEIKNQMIDERVIKHLIEKDINKEDIEQWLSDIIGRSKKDMHNG